MEDVFDRRGHLEPPITDTGFLDESSFNSSSCRLDFSLIEINLLIGVVREELLLGTFGKIIEEDFVVLEFNAAEEFGELCGNEPASFVELRHIGRCTEVVPAAGELDNVASTITNASCVLADIAIGITELVHYRAKFTVYCFECFSTKTSPFTKFVEPRPLLR